MIKGVSQGHLGPIWYHLEPSDVPYSSNQFLALDFFSASYSKIALKSTLYICSGRGQTYKALGAIFVQSSKLNSGIFMN